MVTSVKVSAMCCGSVLPIISVELISQLSYRIFLGKDFPSLDSQGKSSFVLGSELWEENFSSLLELVKGYVLRIWELRKAKLQDNPNAQQSPSQSASGVLPGVTTWLGKYECLCGKAGLYLNYISVKLHPVFWVCDRWPWCCGCCMSYFVDIYFEHD